MKQSDYKEERVWLMGVSIGVSVLLASIIVLALMVGVSGGFILLWLPLVVAFTFMYQSLGLASEETLRKFREAAYKDELSPWNMKQRLESITAWPILIAPLIAWYSAKASFNLIWEDLTKEVEEQVVSEETPKVTT